jgi:hypothetical protein
MAKRNLRVAKWIGMIPAVAVCTCCNREFKVPLDSLRSLPDAQESLRVGFGEHKCQVLTAEGQPDEVQPDKEA